MTQCRTAGWDETARPILDASTYPCKAELEYHTLRKFGSSLCCLFGLHIFGKPQDYYKYGPWCVRMYPWPRTLACMTGTLTISSIWAWFWWFLMRWGQKAWPWPMIVTWGRWLGYHGATQWLTKDDVVMCRQRRRFNPRLSTLKPGLIIYFSTMRWPCFEGKQCITWVNCCYSFKFEI